MKQLSLILVLLLVGCAQSSGEAKSLYSIWTADDGSYIDLTQYNINPSAYMVRPVAGEHCRSLLDFEPTIGEQTDRVFHSQWIDDGTGADPGCAQFNGTGSIYRFKNRLFVCMNGEPCQSFQ